MNMPSAPSAAAPRFIDDYLAYQLARASALVSARFTAELRKRRIPLVAWRVLSALIDTDALSVTALADATLLAQPTLTRVVDRMCDRGLVERRHSERDLRKTLVCVTPRGRDLVADLLRSAKTLEREALGDLADAEVDRLKATLRALIDHCSPRRTEPGARAVARIGVSDLAGKNAGRPTHRGDRRR